MCMKIIAGIRKKGMSAVSAFPLILLMLALIAMACGPSSGGSIQGFTFKENPQGIELSENGSPVFFYQKEPKSANGEFFFNNYLHPLYSVNGDTLTEEFPDDHLHHRGIFWAWHQIYVGEKSLGDGWMMEDFSQEVSDVSTRTIESNAVLNTTVLWKSPAFDDSDPFLEERSKITVYPLQDSQRIIDFEISLSSLVDGIHIGGSDDEKGYGGFSARLRLPDDLVFTSEGGRVTPENLQIQAGPWIDCSGSLGRNGEQYGVTLICQPETPNYPAPWILRQKRSMQNIVFPGRERIEIPLGKPLVLKYRLILHEGNTDLPYRN